MKKRREEEVLLGEETCEEILFLSLSFSFSVFVESKKLLPS